MIKLTLILVLCAVNVQNTPIEEFTSANNLFAPSVYKEVAKSNGNFLVSPFSAETILALTQSGAKGETAEEIRQALHLPNDKDKVESALKTLLPKVKGNELYTLHTANKVYVKPGFTIKPEFKNAATQVYGADVEPVDFSKKIDAAKTMNTWVEKQTNEKIQNLIDSSSLDENTRAVLINALYFKANWSKHFDMYNTNKADFHTPQGVVKVDTLHHYQEHFNYHESASLDAKFLELPFEGGEASMVIVLPNQKNGISNLENQLEKVFQASHEIKSEYLNVALPKFKIETSIDFKTVLKNLGVAKMFNAEDADLSGIAGEKGDLIVSEVKQKTYVDVDENGVEAAAATYVVISVPESATLNPPSPKNFNADHPFIFYIKAKDLILFAGRVVDPRK